MRAAVIGVALVVLCGAGFLEVRNTTHRADAAAASAVQAKLDAVPMTVGGWAGEKLEYDAKQMDRTKAFAALHRAYRNPKTNEVVSVLILAGAAADVGVHDPTRCYAGAGYRPVGSQQKRPIDPDAGGRCAVWTARFDTDTFPAVSLQVNWAWSLDGVWAAAEDARYEFGREPVLYKLYVSRRLNTVAAGPTPTADPTESFLAEFFPAVQDALRTK